MTLPVKSRNAAILAVGTGGVPPPSRGRDTLNTDGATPALPFQSASFPVKASVVSKGEIYGSVITHLLAHGLLQPT